MEFLELGYSDERFNDTVNDDLHCVICMNVLRDPVHCGPNEHYFCRKCLTRHIKNSHNCPSCKNNLSLETLKPPSRFVTNRLSQLIIRCDNLERGCHELVELGELSGHVKSCGFSPVQCINKGCSLILNRCDHEDHVRKVCGLREKCADCDDTRKELEKVKTSLEAVREQLDSVCEIKQAVAQSDTANYVRQDFIIMGGCEIQNMPLDSVEMFNWSTKEWESQKPMKKARVKASSFIYKKQIIISGGLIPDQSSHPTETSVCNSMEKTNFADSSLEWVNFPVLLPTKRSAHKCLVYQDHLIVIGGYDDKQGKFSAAIHEVRLKPPYSSQVVARMPSQRKYHGAEMFGDKVVIVGGVSTGSVDTCLSSVLEYDLKSKLIRGLPRLPFPVSGMATVRWGSDKLVLIGGVNQEGQKLNSVVLYDVNTGKSTMLPAMRYKRGGSSAIVTGNVIVVMGGVNSIGRLRSVECFTFNSYTWEELPSMKRPRSYASAAVKSNT